jgi:hypothetical protein
LKKGLSGKCRDEPEIICGELPLRARDESVHLFLDRRIPRGAPIELIRTSFLTVGVYEG